MTEPQRRQRPGRLAHRTRLGIITAGLGALVALSYHSATSPAPSATGHNHPTSELVSLLRPLPTQAASQAPSSAPLLPPAAGEAAARPDPADPADPANRKQTSLQDAANREHPVAGSNPPAAPQGPPPSPRGSVLPSEVFGRGAANLGGCLEEYGENGQCLPAVPPSLAQHLQDMRNAGGNPNSMEHRWSCTELRKYFQDGVVVRQGGVDPQNLDANRDGRACGAGD